MKRLEETGYVEYLRSERGQKGAVKRLYTLTFPGLCGGMYVVSRRCVDEGEDEDRNGGGNKNKDRNKDRNGNVNGDPNEAENKDESGNKDEGRNENETENKNETGKKDEDKDGRERWIEEVLSEDFLRQFRYPAHSADHAHRDHSAHSVHPAHCAHCDCRDSTIQAGTGTTPGGSVVADSRISPVSLVSLVSRISGQKLQQSSGPEGSGPSERSTVSGLSGLFDLSGLSEQSEQSKPSEVPEVSELSEESEKSAYGQALRRERALEQQYIHHLSSPPPSFHDPLSSHADLILTIVCAWSALHPLLSDWPHTVVPSLAGLASPSSLSSPSSPAGLSEETERKDVEGRKDGKGRNEHCTTTDCIHSLVKASLAQALYVAGISALSVYREEIRGKSVILPSSVSLGFRSEFRSRIPSFSSPVSSSPSSHCVSSSTPDRDAAFSASAPASTSVGTFSQTFVHFILHEADCHAFSVAIGSPEVLKGSDSSNPPNVSNLSNPSDVPDLLDISDLSELSDIHETPEDSKTAFLTVLSALKTSPTVWAFIQQELEVRVKRSLTQVQAYLQYLDDDTAECYLRNPDI